MKEQSRILELMKQYNLDGPNDRRKWELLQSSFDFERGRIEETSKRVDELAAALALKQLKFMEECVDESVKLSRLLVPVIVSIRDELELPIDESEFGRMLEGQVARQTEIIKEFSQQVGHLLPPEARS